MLLCSNIFLSLFPRLYLLFYQHTSALLPVLTFDQSATLNFLPFLPLLLLYSNPSLSPFSLLYSPFYQNIAAAPPVLTFDQSATFHFLPFLQLLLLLSSTHSIAFSTSITTGNLMLLERFIIWSHLSMHFTGQGEIRMILPFSLFIHLYFPFQQNKIVLFLQASLFLSQSFCFSLSCFLCCSCSQTLPFLLVIFVLLSFKTQWIFFS